MSQIPLLDDKLKLAFEMGKRDGYDFCMKLMNQVGYLINSNQEINHILDEFRVYAIRKIDNLIETSDMSEAELDTHQSDKKYYMEASYADLISDLVANITHKIEVSNYHKLDINFQGIFDMLLPNELV